MTELLNMAHKYENAAAKMRDLETSLLPYREEIRRFLKSVWQRVFADKISISFGDEDDEGCFVTEGQVCYYIHLDMAGCGEYFQHSLSSDISENFQSTLEEVVGMFSYLRSGQINSGVINGE